MEMTSYNALKGLELWMNNKTHILRNVYVYVKFRVEEPSTRSSSRDLILKQLAGGHVSSKYAASRPTRSFRWK